MNGLLLSKMHYEAYWVDMENKLKERFDVASAYGLFGEGSECFGFDDELSRDHHWGAGLCIWLPDHAPQEAVTYVNDFYTSLPPVFQGYPVRKPEGAMERRLGAFKVSTFLHHILGVHRLPQTWQEWLDIPEYALATMTNGIIMKDHDGIIRPIRDHFTRYYPQDVCTKKIAIWAMIMGQAGQYNYTRCLKRKDGVTAHYTLGLFIEATAGMVHVLNRRYMPYYKWMHRSLEALPVLGTEANKVLQSLVENMKSHDGMWSNCRSIEDLCWKVVVELQNQGFTKEDKDFLFDQGPLINAGIKDDSLRNQPLFLS